MRPAGMRGPDIQRPRRRGAAVRTPAGARAAKAAAVRNGATSGRHPAAIAARSSSQRCRSWMRMTAPIFNSRWEGTRVLLERWPRGARGRRRLRSYSFWPRRTCPRRLRGYRRAGLAGPGSWAVTRACAPAWPARRQGLRSGATGGATARCAQRGRWRAVWLLERANPSRCGSTAILRVATLSASAPMTARASSACSSRCAASVRALPAAALNSAAG